MADKKKSRYARITSPKAIARYCWLTKPNTKFDPEGVFTCDLVLPKDEAQPFLDIIEGHVERAFEGFQADPANKKIVKKMVKQYPFSDETDDDGNETGNVIIKFKRRAKFKDKDTGEIVPITLSFFNAKGEEFRPEALYGGSLLRVNATVKPYLMDSTKAVGVTLLINGVQVIKAASGNGSAASMGFGNEAPDDEAPDEDAADPGAGAEPPADDNDDF